MDIKTWQLPLRNLYNERSRSSCSIPPWKIPHWNFLDWRYFPTRSTLSRWLQNTNVEWLPNVHSNLYNVSSLSFPGESTLYKCKRCTVCSSVFKKFNLIVLFRPVNWGISSASVAESKKRRFKRGNCPITVAISSWKPNSRHLSNSSMTNVVTVSASIFCFERWSFIRPGVPMTTEGCTPLIVRCSSMAGRPP